MNLIEIYEKFKHLDPILSDKRWLELDEEGNLTNQILFDLWQAIKEEVKK